MRHKKNYPSVIIKKTLLSRALCLNYTETNIDTIKYQNICEIPKHSICEIALIEIKIFFEPLRLYEGFRTAITIAEIDISVYKEVFEANYFQTGVFWSRSDKKWCFRVAHECPLYLYCPNKGVASSEVNLVAFSHCMNLYI